MNDEKTTAISTAREWRGNHKTWVDSHRRYEFPVKVRKVGDVSHAEASNR
ncbi:hypothetical protein [Streptomyces sp. NPDC014733]